MNCAGNYIPTCIYLTVGQEDVNKRFFKKTEEGFAAELAMLLDSLELIAKRMRSFVSKRPFTVVVATLARNYAEIAIEQ